jgi:hypothetical protein
MKNNKNLNDKMIGRMLLLNAIKLEKSLAELLMIEVKSVKRQLKRNSNIDYVRRTNKIIKYILYSLTMLDDRIQAGLKLLDKE